MENQMKGPEAMKSLGEQIREARETRRWSQKDLADVAGSKQQTVDRIERGITKKSEDLPALCAVLGIRSRDVDKMASSYSLETEADIPVVYTKTTSEGVFLTEIVGANKRRAHSLITAPETYGIFVPADCCMAPIFRAGEILLINPHQAPRPGDRCLFRDADDNKSRVKLGELAGEDAATWSLKVVENGVTIEKSAFPHAHLIVACLRG
jgi:transcriptional regulator with XRE-family HTH domain